MCIRDRYQRRVHGVAWRKQHCSQAARLARDMQVHMHMAHGKNINTAVLVWNAKTSAAPVRQQQCTGTFHSDCCGGSAQRHACTHSQSTAQARDSAAGAPAASHRHKRVTQLPVRQQHCTGTIHSDCGGGSAHLPTHSC
eukprot:TRINITY_DN7858_c0_g1_i5.p2 TRINITY_DN7858_c0_g1~~TRINITY_DN7858_c0_g1_i5.p2  ORF type:complete len:139 (-),score=28.86 TRINITY_DN7858_c0_g1_i5:1767-2183(-)